MLLNKKIPLSYIFKKAQKHFFTVTAISVVVYIIQQQLIYVLPTLPVSIPVFLGTAISLILSFNLNQSYERWWEARKIWGAIVNDSRTLIIQMRSFAGAGNDELIRRMAYRQIAWNYCLGQSLRGSDPFLNMDKYLSAAELAELSAHQNKPLALLDMHSRDLKRLKESGQLEVFHHVQLDSTIVRLCDSMGKAERIKSTVFPTTYSLFLHALIYIFITLLSVSLSEIDGGFEIPLLIIISVPFLLLERTAKDMQDPFSGYATDTPVTSIANTIEVNLKQLVNDPDLPAALPNNSFFID